MRRRPEEGRHPNLMASAATSAAHRRLRARRIGGYERGASAATSAVHRRLRARHIGGYERGASAAGLAAV